MKEKLSRHLPNKIVVNLNAITVIYNLKSARLKRGKLRFKNLTSRSNIRGDKIN
jgi:hypothetical protein